MEKVSAFQFENFSDYLKYRLEKEMISRTTGRKKSNLIEIAKKLGYASPSTLCMVANGKRTPGATILNALFDYWDLPHKEREYIRVLVRLDKARKRDKDLGPILRQLERYTASAPTAHKITLKQFSSMKDWYYLVLKILVSCPDFQESPEWICAKLRRKVSAAKIQEAIGTLLELGFVERDPATGKLRPSIGTTDTPTELPSEAIRQHHKGMMARAIEAIDEQDVEARQFNSVTLRFDPKDLPRAKQRLLEIAREFNAEFESSQSAEVFQLNLQFFSHTVRPQVMPKPQVLRRSSNESH